MITARYIFITLFATLVWGAASCTRKPATDQPEKLIRAADAEISGLAVRLAETHGLQALLRVYKLRHLLLPAEQSAKMLSCDSTFPGQEAWIAQARLDTSPEGYRRITFPYRFKNDSLATFILKSWKTGKSLLMDDFPTAMDCEILTASGIKLLEINYQARLKHQLPEWYSLEARLGAFEIESDLKTHFRKKNSTLRVNFLLKESGVTKISSGIHSMVELAEDGSLRFGKKNIRFETFPIVVDARSERGFHTYDVRQFVRDFNADNRIVIFDHMMNRLGSVGLVEETGKDFINPVVSLNDGKTYELERLMMSLRQLLRMKLHNI